MFSSIFIVFVALSIACSQSNTATVRQARPLSSSSFDEIIVDGSFDVHLTQLSSSDSAKGMASTPVEIETTADIQPHIIVEIVDGHILSISVKDVVIHENMVHAFIQISSPLRRYTVKGAGNTVAEGNGLSNPGNDKFVLENHGSANVDLQLDVNEFEAHLSGAGKNHFWGHVRNQATFDVHGTRDVNALDLVAKQVIVKASGMSNARVAATDDLQIKVSGMATVNYKLPDGKKPSKSNASGSGKILPIS